MNERKKKVLAICGSTRTNSANLQLLNRIASLGAAAFEMEVYSELSSLPHFNPDLDKETSEPPKAVQEIRKKIQEADGVLICTPEYVFSIPGSLKNLIEWTVSTTIFSEKPVALITASASGGKAHESLQLIMKTIYADLAESSQLLISGARSKFDEEGNIIDADTLQKIRELVDNFAIQIERRIKM
jgi:chromate reductase